MNRWVMSLIFVLGALGCSSKGEITEVQDSAQQDSLDARGDQTVDPDGVLDVIPTDLRSTDQVSTDLREDLAPDQGCEPQCAGKECGDNGCGGDCGKCPGAAPICDGGVCKVECKPSCEGRECGDDGCGGNCGTCPGAAPFCKAGMCAVTCDADCTGIQCGDDGCGGSCGQCDAGWYCEAGSCTCDPKCANKECGDNGCGGVCGQCPEASPYCISGVCKGSCTPDCGGKQCGEDGCGGTCGPCDGPNQSCQNGLCICAPNCPVGACGDNGCGGKCPSCPCGLVCGAGGMCEEWACKDKQCGSDGCGGNCGVCPGGYQCSPQGLCQDSCDLACIGRQCGQDGCGGICGLCTDGKLCNDSGICVQSCVPDCTGKACGSNGCGGVCGQCAPATPFCDNGVCGSLCVPECGMKVCGEDGCGGSCGACDYPLQCTVGGSCGGLCAYCGYEPECFDITFAEGNLGMWNIEGSDVVTNFGLTPAVTGGHMLQLTTAAQEELNSDASQASFQNCLPPGNYQILISWKLISEEFKEFCGSAYQDSFTMRVVTAAGIPYEISYDIDQLCPPTECTGCGEHFSSLNQSDVELDQGDAWHTDWYVDAIPLVLTGPDTRFTITLTAEDAGDGIFDTVVLVDRIRFETCQDACGEIECGPTACGVDCGSCPQNGLCIAGTCCMPTCDGTECGTDGCGGSCGACGVDTICINGICECKNIHCSDGCCDPGEVCGVASGKCCKPQCSSGTPCAANGCGGFCPGPGGAVCCSNVSQCNDNNPCTVDLCTSGSCTHTPAGTPECCAEFNYFENFDDGVADNFTFTTDDMGLPGMGSSWLATNLCGAHSPSYSLYFGFTSNPFGGANCTYGLGGFPLPVGGTATSPVLGLPDAPTVLGFWVSPNILASDLDVLSVSVVQGTTVTVIWDKSDLVGGVGASWRQVSLDLAPYAGENIQIRFSFSSTGGDSTLTGPRFDDISVQGLCGP